MEKSKLLLIGIVLFLAACSDTASEFESEMNDDNPSTECTLNFRTRT